ncbi:unannotated protein [freshwater metagenome]|uniref:Unannotated protein n=1 Tax=freshwater metagenome TaxID=449393 RepID=A0A6J7HTB2_9ZZZZ
MPQSIASSATIWARRCSCGASRGWTVKSSGMFSCELMTVSIWSSEIAVSTSAAGPCRVSSRWPAVMMSCEVSEKWESSPSVRVSWKMRSSCS